MALFLFSFFILIPLCSFLISRKLFLFLKKKSIKGALLISIFAFLACFAVVNIIILYIIESNTQFER